MKRRRPLGLLLLGICLTVGCAEGHLYPVQGQFSSQSPSPVFTAKMGGGFHSGNISAVLASGEKATGRWEWTQTESPSAESSAAENPGAESLASVWDAVYGQGFYVSRVLGTKPFARAVVTGDHGTILHMEMYRPVGEGGEVPVNFRGVARDNKNNIYKVVF
jgi:hypothetical protein